MIATTSCWLQAKINPESLDKIVSAYGEIHSNLLIHDKNYPNANSLSKLIKSGLPKYGMLGVGEEMDSEGSDWIIKILEEDDDRPLWISVWGGVNTLAQSLHKIKNTKSEKEAKRLISKLRVYTISDQDDSGIWIRNNFPDLFYIVSPGDEYSQATCTGINSYIKGIDNTTISNDWIAKHIQQNHGPLGANYPDVAWGVEGDTPAFLSLIPNGLNDAEHPELGGWGGRYELYKPDFSKTKKGGSIVTIAPETRVIWTNTNDSYSPHIPNEYGRSIKPDTITFNGYKETLWRWRDDLDSIDPDGDNLSFLWFQYPEIGSYKKKINMGADNVHIVNLTAPEVSKKETLHFILKVSDKGTPVLSRYKRVIVTVLPK